MQERLQRNVVDHWAQDFMSELLATREEQKKLGSSLLAREGREQLLSDFARASRRLLMLDYDGTLIPFAPRPELAVPGPELLDLLSRLADNPRNEIVLVSGRDRHTLDKWFGMLPVGIVAEHGVWLKERAGEWALLKPLTDSWKMSICPLLEAYVSRVPGSFIEEKDYSLVWHYRQADPEQGTARAQELFSQLVSYMANMDVQVLQGNKVIEVKSAGVNKGTAAMRWIYDDDFHFILAIGDDWTDEDLFAALPESAYSLKVGMAQSYAKANIRDHKETLRLLEELADL
jgi:trehalose 6-phosphate synthase/phosphatase